MLEVEDRIKVSTTLNALQEIFLRQVKEGDDTSAASILGFILQSISDEVLTIRQKKRSEDTANSQRLLCWLRVAYVAQAHKVRELLKLAPRVEEMSKTRKLLWGTLIEGWIYANDRSAEDDLGRHIVMYWQNRENSWKDTNARLEYLDVMRGTLERATGQLADREKPKRIMRLLSRQYGLEFDPETIRMLGKAMAKYVSTQQLVTAASFLNITHESALAPRTSDSVIHLSLRYAEDLAYTASTASDIVKSLLDEGPVAPEIIVTDIFEVMLSWTVDAGSTEDHWRTLIARYIERITQKRDSGQYRTKITVSFVVFYSSGRSEHVLYSTKETF